MHEIFDNYLDESSVQFVQDKYWDIKRAYRISKYEKAQKKQRLKENILAGTFGLIMLLAAGVADNFYDICVAVLNFLSNLL